MTNGCPLFSVVIPVFNRRELVRQALESVLRQRFTDFEVIVVDDGSSDGSAEAARRVGPAIRVLEQPNAGPGAARNLGGRAARGRYLAFLDCDDAWFPWTLEIYARTIQSCGEPVFIAGKPQRLLGQTTAPVLAEKPIALTLFPDYYSSGDEWRWWGTSSFVVKREEFHSVGGFTDEKLNGEDADLAMRLGVAPGFVQVCDPDTFAYRIHAAGETRNLAQTVQGGMLMVEAERFGHYPGGAARAVERRRIIGRHLRPVIAACFREGLHRDGWQLYADTLRWNVKAHRWKFLVGAPLQAVKRLATSGFAG